LIAGALTRDAALDPAVDRSSSPAVSNGSAAGSTNQICQLDVVGHDQQAGRPAAESCSARSVIASSAVHRPA
jgi:hypothetical protein